MSGPASGPEAGHLAGHPLGRVAVVPPVPALLPERAGLADPVPGLRAACDAAVAEVVADATQVVVLHDPLGPEARARGVTEALGARVADVLLHRAGWTGRTTHGTPADVCAGSGLGSGRAAEDLPSAVSAASVATSVEMSSATALLVLASGSARRHEKAPGHLDERSFAFDEAVGRALAAGDPAALADLDADLGDELLAAGVRCLHALAALLLADGRPRPSGVRWAGDPYGVQYWVAVLGPGSRTPD